MINDRDFNAGFLRMMENSASLKSGGNVSHWAKNSTDTLSGSASHSLAALITAPQFMYGQGAWLIKKLHHYSYWPESNMPTIYSVSNHQFDNQPLHIDFYKLEKSNLIRKVFLLWNTNYEHMMRTQTAQAPLSPVKQHADEDPAVPAPPHQWSLPTHKSKSCAPECSISKTVRLI